MGYAFTFPVVRMLSSGTVPVGAYVHFPTISTSMLTRVRTRASTYANSQRITSSPVLSSAKLLYYRAFMWMYAGALRRAAFVMVNSTWTKEHVDGILGYRDWVLDGLVGGVGGVLGMISLSGAGSSEIGEKTVPPEKAQIVYPPCETQELVGFPLEGRAKVIVSIAQFRFIFTMACNHYPFAHQHFFRLTSTDQRKTTPLSFVRSRNCLRSIPNTGKTCGW